MECLEQKIGELILKYRWYIVIAFFLIVALAMSGARYLDFNNDSRIYFSKENPQLQALETLENTFTKDQNLLFVLAPKDGNVFTTRTLKAVQELTEASWKIPYSNRVDSITNFQHTTASGDDLYVRDLVEDPQNLTKQDLKKIKETALNEPLLVNRIISSRGHVTAVVAQITKPGKSKDESFEVTKFARQLAKDVIEKNYPNIDVYVTGGIVMDSSFGEASKKDMTTLIPIMYAVLMIIMGLTLRSITGTLVTFIVIGASMGTAMGIAGWLKYVLNPSSVNAPTIILTLAVADSIHILMTIFQHMRQGKSKNEAIIESMRINLQPVFITSLTTAIGFLTMNFSDAPPFRDLGNIVAIGVIMAFLYSIIFLPACVAILPVKIKPQNGRKKMFWENYTNFIINHRKSLLFSLVAIAVVISAGISKIELNDDFIRYFDQRYEFRRAVDFTEENLTGFYIIEYSLNAGEPNGINSPQFLKTLEQFTQWYRKNPKVVHVLSLTDTLKRLNKNMHNDDPTYYRIPDSRELAAQYLLLYEMNLPFGLDLNNQINVDKSAVRMVVSLKDTTMKDIRAIDAEARNWLSKNAPPSMYTYGTGLSVMFAHISQRNIKSMLGASFGALLIISAILVIVLKSFKFGLISLFPNLTPAFMSFGLWGIFKGEVGLVISIIAALTLGIVVDDTIHFLSKYLRARREYHLEPREAIHFAFNTVGNALWMTSLILIAGFLILATSGFKLNSEMGLMTAITIAIALIMDFIFLPILLLLVEGKQS